MDISVHCTCVYLGAECEPHDKLCRDGDKRRRREMEKRTNLLTCIIHCGPLYSQVYTRGRETSCVITEFTIPSLSLPNSKLQTSLSLSFSFSFSFSSSSSLFSPLPLLLSPVSILHVFLLCRVSASTWGTLQHAQDKQKVDLRNTVEAETEKQSVSVFPVSQSLVEMKMEILSFTFYFPNHKSQIHSNGMLICCTL